MLAVAVAGCASMGTHANHAVDQQSATRSFVDQRMANAVSSAASSLKLLVALDNGDAGARKPGFIGSTVAGASTQPSIAPSLPLVAQPQTPEGRSALAATQAAAAAATAARIAYNRLALDQLIRAHWHGSAAGLLRQVSNAIGYRYVEDGTGYVPDVTVHKDRATATDVLEAVADQISPITVKVLVGPRVICLAHAGPQAQCR